MPDVSNYLRPLLTVKAIEERGPALYRISGFHFSDFGDGTGDQPVVEFDSYSQNTWVRKNEDFKLHRSNFRKVRDLYGPNTDDWKGQMIAVLPTISNDGTFPTTLVMSPDEYHNAETDDDKETNEIMNEIFAEEKTDEDDDDANDILISTKRAAGFSGFSMAQLILLAEKGKIDGAYKVGNRWMFSRNKLRAFLKR